MAYNQFTIPQLERDFGLRIHRQTGLFSAAPPAAISDLLRLTLAQNSRLALPSGSEKARSEYLIAPILAEVCQQKREQETVATADTDLYYLTNVEKIVGILLSMLRQDVP